MHRTGTQNKLDFPIRKATRNKKVSQALENENKTTPSPGKRSRGRPRKIVADLEVECTTTKIQTKTRETHSVNNGTHQEAKDSLLDRTPTKRKIDRENDKENGCSPQKTSPAYLQTENQKNYEDPKENTSETADNDQDSRSGGPRVPFSPLKNSTVNPSLNANEVITRSKSPFKSPAKPSLSSVSSPHKSIKRLTFQSPSKSPLRRLELSSPAKSLLRGAYSPIRHLGKGVASEIDSPRRSPRKLNFEPSSPRRSPRKLPMSPRKFSSPSTLVSSLSLSSPSSTKKAISVGLFKPDVTAYRSVRQTLNSGTPTTLVCREEQISAMKDFLSKHLEKGKPGSLYISGAPGTGKTACLTSLVANMKEKQFRQIFLNCMTVKTSASIYGKIVSGLGLQPRATEKENSRLIEKTLMSSKNPVLIILDEIDQLDSKNQEVLYSIFEWPSLKDSKLVLVGIANALDLTDRVLPRLQARPTFKPQLLHFPPYSKAEIVKILNQRIEEAGLEDVQIIRPSAIQFLAGKVAAVAGDVRKALDVCRRAVELCEIQARRQSVLKPSLGSPRKSPRKSPQKQGAGLKVVEIPQIMAIFNEVYGSRVISAVQNAPESFSLQQKLLICCLLMFLKHAKSKDITLGKFHELYTKICKKRSIPDMDQSEFLSLCTLLESRGMLQVKRAKEVRSSKVILRLNPEEAERVLGDRSLLAAVLEDKECLGKLCKK
ncbi:cell division control protein 6 homolog [Macrobrachium nipponense]|uniref:cell division control protein 6 homolog n=1 Tax=Macrobrachium nipponense TaxID=159736 RepID=UPI0030C8106D